MKTNHTQGSLAEKAASRVQAQETERQLQKQNEQPPSPTPDLMPAKVESAAPASSPAPTDLTEQYKKEYTPIQEKGDVKAINEFREKVKKDVQDGKVVSDDLLKQLELPGADEIRKSKPAPAAAPTAASKTEEAQPTPEKLDWEDENFGKAPGEEQPAAKKDDPTKKETETKILSEKSKKYDELSNDPFVKAYLSAKESGKDVNSFMSEIQGTNPDKMSDEEIFEVELSESSLTDDEKLEERARFKDLTPLQRKKEIAPTKEKLKGRQSERLGKYAQNNAASKQEQDRLIVKANQEKEQFLKKIEGKTWMGVQVTPTEVEALNSFVDNYTIFTEDGSLDIPKLMRIGMYESKGKVMLQNAYNKGLFEGENRALKKTARPSADNGITNAPAPERKKSDTDNVDTFKQNIKKSSGVSMEKAS